MQSLSLPLLALCIHWEASQDAVWILLLYTINSPALNFMSQTRCSRRCILKCLHAFYIKCDCPAASVSLTVYTCCSRARTRFLTGICFSCHFLWLLTMTQRSISVDGPLLLAVNQTLIHTSQIVPFFFFCSFFFVTTKAWEMLKEGLRMTSPWTGYSQVDESISYIVCRNRFSSVPTCVRIGKGWNFAIKY